tara:strand:+ start:1890 stop:3071 length:1182 start_codon:yes stop_codon:yes gene_type:complete
MLTKNIFFQNFKNLSSKSVKNNLKKIIKYDLNNKKNLIFSLRNEYKYSYDRDKLNFLKKKNSLINIIGMGGSILGSKAIYYFLKDKIKKKFFFTDNLSSFKNNLTDKKKLNIVISKSGNTLETIINANTTIKKKDKNIIITEKNKNFLNILANELKAEVIEHKNFIGGRYSVLSEVGMLPAELMGLKVDKFKQINNLIKKPNFLKLLCKNVECTLSLIKKKKINSIILNYDERSDNFFKWYQQLISESLGKKSKGILPIISSMPKDNHSLLQFYLDGPKNNFFTFFYIFEKKSNIFKTRNFYNDFNFLNNKNVNEIQYIQKIATQNIFSKKKIPFRSFEILKRSEETLGELFSFFILETILLGKALNINPFDQPSVELIKKETKRIFLKSSSR